jgi:23S rRNA pseudouridine1911/1915/1917 synthase
VETLFEVLSEDADLLVINKPAGLVCHPTKTDEYSSLIGRVRLFLPKTVRPHMINRLDRETSGVVIVAKNPIAAGELGKLWESRSVTKEYQAIVHGHIEDGLHVVEAPLGKDEQSRIAIKDCVRPDGVPARTAFWLERHIDRAEPDSGDTRRFSLVRVAPHTGRKHQIRIHLAHVGHAIVGDKLYGGDEDLYLALVEDRLTPEQRGRLMLRNHALHARSVRFEWRGAERVFTAEPDPCFMAFVGACSIAD